jgi:hypothetical protein
MKLEKAIIFNFTNLIPMWEQVLRKFAGEVFFLQKTRLAENKFEQLVKMAEKVYESEA